MFDDLVRHYVMSEQPLPPALLTGYDYILAGNGVWKRARNRHVEVMMRVATARIPGLPDVEPYVRLACGPLPGALLHTMLLDARRRAWDRPREAMYLVYADGERARLAYPRQRATAGRIEYEGAGDPAVIAEIHSHCELSAFWSSTDNADEVGFRFYGVFGQIFTRPAIRLRLGVHGDHVILPLTTLFTHSGPFNLNGWERDYGQP